VSIKRILGAKIIGGRLVFDNPDMYREHLISVARMDGDTAVDVTIERHRKKRSNAENSYYWSVPIKILAEHFGYTPEEMHGALKWLFLRVHRDGMPDTVRNSRDLSTTEFEEYCSNIRIWASNDWGVFIPEPNEGVEWDIG